MTRSRLLALVAAAVLAGCGSDAEEAATTATATPAPTETAAPAPALTDTSQKPVVPKPTGEPPSRLERDDIVKGTGAAARAGDQVTVQYVGILHSTGEQFDASWDRGQPLPPFALGTGAVIPGWDRGVAGMKVGGRRQLTIPPDLAYGDGGSPPSIGPGETLVFMIDMLDVQKG